MDDDEAGDGITSIDLESPDGSDSMLDRRELNPLVLDWIGRELRDHYEEVLREPVPLKLLAIIDQRLARRAFH